MFLVKYVSAYATIGILSQGIKMEKFSVGPDEIKSYYIKINEDLYEWLVYWYKDNYYDGEGEAVALRKSDGKLAIKNLMHCSCYGPMDCWETGATIVVSIEEWLRPKDSIFDVDCMDSIKVKVNSLLS